MGSITAYSLAQKELASEVVLIDNKHEKLISESLDISHSLSNKQTLIRAGNYSDISDSSVIIITAGIGRKAGETRDDLLLKNASIMKDIIFNIKPYYKDNIVIVVANPVDVMANLVSHLLKAKREKIIGSGTLLDTARLKYELSDCLNIAQKEIECLVIGEHGNNCLILWNSIEVAHKPINKIPNLDRDNIIQNVHKSGNEIIKGKGFTCYGIAAEICNLVENLKKDSHTILPLSIGLEGEYDINDVFLSLPCLITSSGVEKVITPEISEQELGLLKASAEKLKNYLKKVF